VGGVPLNVVELSAVTPLVVESTESTSNTFGSAMTDWLNIVRKKINRQHGVQYRCSIFVATASG
jgi:hypothetical protein